MDASLRRAFRFSRTHRSSLVVEWFQVSSSISGWRMILRARQANQCSPLARLGSSPAPCNDRLWNDGATLRSASVGHQSRQPERPRLSCLLLSSFGLPRRSRFQIGLRTPRGDRRLLPRSFSLCQQAPCLPVRGCSGNGDEQPLHIQPGSPQLGRYDSHQLVPLAVQRCQTLQPARYQARPALEGSRTAVRLHAPVAVVAAHRLQVSRDYRLAPGAVPAPAAPVILPLQPAEGNWVHCCLAAARLATANRRKASGSPF